MILWDVDSLMSAEDLLKKLPQGGFLKVAQGKPSPLSQDTRAALIRKGNELFNKGELDLAKRIFLTTHYSDGLIRLGDAYFKKGRSLDALRAYWLAPSPEKVTAVAERIALVMREWLREEKKTESV